MAVAAPFALAIVTIDGRIISATVVASHTLAIVVEVELPDPPELCNRLAAEVPPFTVRTNQAPPPPGRDKSRSLTDLPEPELHRERIRDTDENRAAWGSRYGTGEGGKLVEWLRPTRNTSDDDADEVRLVARGIATAVAPETGLTDVQADLLEAIATRSPGSRSTTGARAAGRDELAEVLAGRDLHYRQRIVHHMVLGELVLRPIPTVVAHRVAKYAEALGVKDEFVRVARRYAQGAYGLAWKDLQRNGFVDDAGAGGDRRLHVLQQHAE